MWRKIGRIVGITIGWGLILAYILYASNLTNEYMSQQRVTEIIISLPDSTETHCFTSTAQIRQQLEESGLKMENELVGNVDAVNISQYLAKKGFVRDVDAYVTYGGKMYIDIWQHKPVLRMLCGGMNSYVTAEGYIFRVPNGSSYYTSVVTGSYKPRFARDYEGVVFDYFDEAVERENQGIDELGKQLSALRRKQEKCAEQLSESKRAEADKYREELAQMNAQEEELTKQHRTLEDRKKKLQRKCEDFANLANFVAKVSNDPFWSAEIVQYVADTTYVGDISLRMVPRSGNFVIEFGTLNNSDEKLAKLRKFYDKGLSYMGWDRYKMVDVRYDKQIICTE